ncbi:hypothetical protein VT03_32780 [Planctomyces sp. SH-PL14]|nr:hypothetical protein VT03_32780 [Planctomyces sp. SH-PL14]
MWDVRGNIKLTASQGQGVSPIWVQGAPWWGVQRGNAPLPAGGPLVERYLKEGVSKRGRRVVCPLTNPPGLQSQL